MGEIYKSRYNVRLADGTMERRVSPNYTVRWVGPNKRRMTKSGFKTKAKASAYLKTVEAQALDVHTGMGGVNLDNVVCTELAEQYYTSMQSRCTEQHVGHLRAQLTAVFEHTQAYSVAQLTPAAIEGYMAALVDDGLAARTINTYLQAVKGWLRWAVRRRLLPYSPVDCVQKLRESTATTVRKRRPLTDPECAALIQAALVGPLRRAERSHVADAKRKPRKLPLAQQAELAQQGRRNALIYAILINTGLRVNELRHLQWADVDLDESLLHVRAAWSKNSRDAVLPLPAHLVTKLRQWRTATKPKAKAPVVAVTTTITRTFHADCKLAKIARQDSAGRVVDLHALRHTYSQRLSRCGTDPKTMQALMRHSTPVLTLGVYVHSDRQRLAAAVAGLADVGVATKAKGQVGRRKQRSVS